MWMYTVIKTNVIVTDIDVTNMNTEIWWNLGNASLR
jgi:hypothetical protein